MQTSPKPDIRSLAALPGHKAHLTGQIYEAGKRPGDLDRTIKNIIRSVRLGSILEVVDLVWLAGEGRGDRRKHQLVDNIEAAIEKGGKIKETSTGNATPKHKAVMLSRALAMIGKRQSAANGSKGGRPATAITDHEKVVQEGVWHSRRYKNNDERVTAIKKRNGWSFGPTELRKRYGPPGGQEAANA
jgi:hypothetical protein